MIDGSVRSISIACRSVLPPGCSEWRRGDSVVDFNESSGRGDPDYVCGRHIPGKQADLIAARVSVPGDVVVDAENSGNGMCFSDLIGGLIGGETGQIFFCGNR